MLSPVTNPSQYVVFFYSFFINRTLITNLAGENVKACGIRKDKRTSHCFCCLKMIAKNNLEKYSIFDLVVQLFA